MHNLSVLSFFFTNKTSALHEETPRWMYFLSISSCSCDFSYVSSIIFIWYKDFEYGTAPGMRSIEKSMYLFGGSPWTSSGNMYSKSFKAGMSSSFDLLSF